MKFSPGSFCFAAAAAIGFSTAPVEVGAAEPWRPELPWDELESQLANATSLIGTSPLDFLDECLPEFEKPVSQRTVHSLIDEPSGLCLANVACAFEGCYPRPHGSTLSLAQRVNDMSNIESLPYKESVMDWVEDTSNPSYNLPSKVLFPTDASDVVAAVNFAKEHGLEISVKNSGHSYYGASTKRDTLHINMNRFRRYADDSITDCDASSLRGGRGSLDVDAQPCRLAAARGKPAFIRVGGGENWDKVYRAVNAANIAADQTTGNGYKYHMVGGAAGTVSPMGWTFQVGLAGTAGGRMMGFGADQVLQVEMVLPNGNHVRFGPTEWEAAEGFSVPRTTKVMGVCRENPGERDEGEWAWSSCPSDANIDFDDLWFAVNGGGGGTWGVITSLYLQLHEYLPLEVIVAKGRYFANQVGVPIGDCPSSSVYDLVDDFLFGFRFLPEAISVPQNESDACGNTNDPNDSSLLICYGGNSFDDVKKAWSRYLTSNQDELDIRGIARQNAEDCFFAREFFDLVALLSTTQPPLSAPYTGRVTDTPPPGFDSGSDLTDLNVLVPKKWVRENPERAIGLFDPEPPYHAFGSGTEFAHDQANSVSHAHRNAIAKVFAAPDYFYSQLFGEMYDITDKSNFPGFLGSNHASLNMLGPMKDDWTKACPAEWTQKKRAERCVSVQEAIYGTKALARLEAIKWDIDPAGMFDCQGCIGNNWAKKGKTAKHLKSKQGGKKGAKSKKGKTAKYRKSKQGGKKGAKSKKSTKGTKKAKKSAK